MFSSRGSNEDAATRPGIQPLVLPSSNSLAGYSSMNVIKEINGG